MKNFKWLSLTLIVIMAVSMVACAGESKTTAQDDAQEVKTIKIGLDDAYPPFEFHDEATNDLIGFDIDFGKALAEEMGVDVEYVPTAWDGIFNGVNTGQYDMIISCVSITPDRVEAFEMTSPYLANGIVIVSAVDGTQAATIEELAGKKVGVQLETTADIAAKKFIANGYDLELSQFNSVMEAFAALKGGSIEYIMVDSSVGGFYISNDPESFQISSGLLSNEPIGVCITKGNEELAADVNNAIAALQEKGTMAEISTKWFSADFATEIDADLVIIE